MGLKYQRIIRRKAIALASSANSETTTNAFVRPTSNDRRQLGIVVTGGTKGFGYALVREFLSAGDRVVLCGRTEARVSAAVASLLEDFPDAELYGIPCNVQSADDMAELARFSCERLGTIDRWINNAGVVSEKVPLFEVSTEDIATVCGTNVLGSMLGCREAILAMRSQADSPVPVYHVFNFGFSAWGALFSSSTCSHKATKKALAQLTTSLSEELTKAGVTSIGVHNLSPGMVVTDLLLKGSTPVARRFFNVLAEEAETVAAELAPQVRQVSGTNGSLEYLSLPDAFRRVVTGVPQIINGGRFFDKEGNRVPERGVKYQENGVRKWYEVPAEE